MLPRLGCRPARNRKLRLRCRRLRNLWPRLDYSLSQNRLGHRPSPNRLAHRPGHNRLGHRPGHNRLGYRLGHNLRLRLRSLPSLPRRPSLRLLRRPPHRSRRRLRRSLRHQQRRRCPRTLQTRHLHRIRCSPTTWGPCSVSCPEQLRLDADGDQIRKQPHPRRAVDAVLIADVNAGALERHLRRAHPGLGKHAAGHVDTVDLVGVQLANDPGSENPCATSDVGHLAGRGRSACGEARRHQFQTDMSSGWYCMQTSVVCAATPLLLKNSFAQFGQFHASCS